MWVEGDDYTGYMDQQGHLNFANQWDRGLPFSNGMALVKKDGYYVKINTKGEIIASTNFIDIFTPYLFMIV